MTYFQYTMTPPGTAGGNIFDEKRVKLPSIGPGDAFVQVVKSLSMYVLFRTHLAASNSPVASLSTKYTFPQPSSNSELQLLGPIFDC
jgi:hypothetical protein